MMMQIRSTVQKLIRSYTTSELLEHIANEIEQEAQHLVTVDAPPAGGMENGGSTDFERCC